MVALMKDPVSQKRGRGFVVYPGEKEENMGNRILSSVVLAGLLLFGITGTCLAGVEPSPFQPEINQLNSLELRVSAINNRLAKLNQQGTLPEGTANYLNAMANQMQGVEAKLAEVLAVLPSPSPFIGGAYIGQEEVVFALAGIRDDAKGSYDILDNIVSRMGIGPSPFLPAFNAVSRSIVIRINDLFVPIDVEFPPVEPPAILPPLPLP